jgi:chromosome segregation ATPase
MLMQDAEQDAAVEAAEKAEGEGESPRRKRERAALQRQCEELGKQRDDFMRQLGSLASNESVDLHWCIRRAVARRVSQIEQLTSERAAWDDELANIKERLKKTDDAYEGCRWHKQLVRRERDDARKKRGEAEAVVRRMQGDINRQKEISEELRRGLDHSPEHAELDRPRDEIATLGPRVRKQTAGIKRLTQIECVFAG